MIVWSTQFYEQIRERNLKGRKSENVYVDYKWIQWNPKILSLAYVLFT